MKELGGRRLLCLKVKMEISFSNPTYLFLLFLIPLFVFLHFVSLRGKKRRALKFANFNAISRVSGVDLYSKNLVILTLTSLIIFFLVFALSGASVILIRDVTQSSFVFAIDVSQSMTAEDLDPNRLEFSKDLSKMFLTAIPPSSKVGLVSFGAYSLIEQELLNQRGDLVKLINDLEVNSVGGTGFYETFVTSSNILFNEDIKAIILFSDGQATIDDVEDAITYAKNKGIMVYTVPIGTIEGGLAVYGISKLDEDTLKGISYQTGGVFIEGKNKEELLNSFKEALEIGKGNVKLDLKYYFLIFAIALVVLEGLLLNLRYGVLP